MRAWTVIAVLAVGLRLERRQLGLRLPARTLVSHGVPDSRSRFRRWRLSAGLVAPCGGIRETVVQMGGHVAARQRTTETASRSATSVMAASRPPSDELDALSGTRTRCVPLAPLSNGIRRSGGNMTSRGRASRYATPRQGARCSVLGSLGASVPYSRWSSTARMAAQSGDRGRASCARCVARVHSRHATSQGGRFRAFRTSGRGRFPPDRLSQATPRCSSEGSAAPRCRTYAHAQSCGESLFERRRLETRPERPTKICSGTGRRLVASCLVSGRRYRRAKPSSHIATTPTLALRGRARRALRECPALRSITVVPPPRTRPLQPRSSTRRTHARMPYVGS
jgi:hypothetical protein